MMMVLAALVVLSVVARVRPAEQATCSEPILCPCGDTDKYVKVCTEEQNPCIKWSNCKTCQDDFDGCLECPEGSEGLWCSKTGLAKSSRQKRQIHGFNTFFEGPSQTTRDSHARGDCPELRSPKHGSIRCTYTNRQGTCVGNCFPGHRFENHGSESEITLKCTGSYYTPLREFPPCISEGYCELDIQGHGTVNCTTSMRGTLCDVVCYGLFMGRYFCLPEQPWEPALPSCVRPKAVITRRVTCPDPGFIENGHRSSYNQVESVPRPSFEVGDKVGYTCVDRSFELQGKHVLKCVRDGKWNHPIPKCVRKAVTYCRDPGIDLNGGRNVQSPSDPQGFLEGSRLEYFCTDGYDIDGERSILCLGSGGWSSERPKCKPKPRQPVSGRTIRYCDELGLIANGEVGYFLPLDQQIASDINGAGYPQYPVGTRLVYSCDIGYVLEGPSKLTCQESGDWSPKIPPNCITRNDQHILSCLFPGPLQNGNILQLSRMDEPRTSSSSPVPEDARVFPEGTTLKYECDEGYTLDGIDTITCTSRGTWTYTGNKCLVDCGFSSFGATHRILHGNKTMVGEWPWVVGIAVERNNHIRIICGGAVLDTRTVITAAHCLTGYDSFILYFGKYYRSVSKDDKYVQVARSDKVIIHPDYNNVTMDSDIGLIKFKPKIKYSLRVQPICLPTGTTTNVNLDVGRKGFVTGWGLNENQVDSGELMMAYLPYQSKQNCLDSFRVKSPNFRLVLTQNMFCAGYPHANQSTCTGDSGSPLVFLDNVTQRHTIEGLVSFTVEGQCGLSGIFSIYTKVYQYTPWINKNL